MTDRNGQRHRPLLLLGAQRSGTTALASVLSTAFAAAGGIFTVNGKLPYLLHRWCTEADLAGRHLRADEILHALHRKSPFGSGTDAWVQSVDVVLRKAAADLAAGSVTSPSALRRRIVSDSRREWTRFGDKYNEYLLELDDVFDTLPDAHLVLPVRQPAEVAASVVRWTGDRPWRPPDVAAALQKWQAWHQPWLGDARTADTGRCTVLEYEQLCAGPGLDRLGELIDLDLRPYATGLRATPATARQELPERTRRTWAELLERAGS